MRGRRNEDFITGRERANKKKKKKKFIAGGRGVSERRSEDFITGRESKQTKKEKNSLPVEGG